ncbi:hypothetical protein U27_01407 [Candidatus Vecturithrix granuli]|uniref:Uncharacterized protein n=1 Tax=Vecturithrix granuli TaxID=1499967 RepID=A0A081CAA1_VECG1|nr:hypothetical protein U27_01407 [Candidatus Vecturithrix granuli]
MDIVGGRKKKNTSFSEVSVYSVCFVGKHIPHGFRGQYTLGIGLMLRKDFRPGEGVIHAIFHNVNNPLIYKWLEDNKGFEVVGDPKP